MPAEILLVTEEVLNGGKINYFVSRNNGGNWTACLPGEITNLSSQASGTQIKWKAVLTGNAELKAIALAF